MRDKLERDFKRIRTLYFPDWEDGSNWQICNYKGQGHCNRDTKTIKIGRATENYSLPVLIIHEIAHAVTTGGHDDMWVNRMRQAAVRAADVSDVQLADELQKHILWVMDSDAEDVSEEDVYRMIADAVRDQPDASFENVGGWVANELGQDLETLVENYPKARERFEKARSSF